MAFEDTLKQSRIGGIKKEDDPLARLRNWNGSQENQPQEPQREDPLAKLRSWGNRGQEQTYQPKPYYQPTMEDAKKQYKKITPESDPYEVFSAFTPANTKAGDRGISSIRDVISKNSDKIQDEAWKSFQQQEEYWQNATAARDAARASGLGTEEWYAQAQADVDKYKAALEDAKKQEEEAKNYIGRDIFTPDATQEDLDRLKAEAAGKYEEAQKGTQTALSDLSEAEKRLQYASYFRWEDLRNSEDFEQKAAEGRAEVEKQKAISVMSGPDVVLNDQLPTDDWSEDQEKLYGYLLVRDQETGGNDAAEYGRNVNSKINHEKKVIQQKKIQYGSDAETAGRYVLSRGAALLSGGDYLSNLLEYASKGYVMEKPYLNPTEYNRTVDSEVTERLNKASGTLPEDWAIIGGKGLGDLAGVGTSAIDSGLAVLIGGGAGSLAIMGSRAASGSYYDAKERGASEEQALAYGAAAGVAEALFEKISIDNLLDADKALTRTLLQNILVQGGIEMSEEMMTSIANDITEVLILQENSEFESTIRTLMQSGMSYDQARQKAMTNAVEGVIFDGISGFLSGGLMQGVNQAVRLPGTAQSGKTIIEQGLAKDLIDVAATSRNDAVRDLAEEMKSGKTATNPTNVGRLLGVMQALDQDLVDEVSGRAEMQQQGAEGQTATQTDEQATKAVRDAADRARERELERARQSAENGAGEEIESASAELGKDAKAIQAVFRKGQDADKYASAMNAGINLMAAEGTNREALDKSNLTAYLTKEQRDIAWEIGHEKYLARQQKAAEQTKRGSEREVSEIREGTVSWDGATIGGKEYAAVDRKTLSKAEREQADVCETFAKGAGIDLVFYDDPTTADKGAYREGGTIYLNVRSKANGETLIVSSFSHELTHFAEEYGGESYEALRGYVEQTLADNDQAKFEQLVEEKRRSRGNISYEEALSEVVADGCEMMLRDTKAPEMLARENPTLLRQICDWLDGWVKKIKAAFTGVSARHEEAKILMERAEELQRRWDKALASAVQNRENARGENENAHSDNENARSENETTAEDGGRVQYSKEEALRLDIEWDPDNRSHMSAQLRKYGHKIAGMKPVFSFSFKNTGKGKYIETLNNILRERFDYKVETKNYGTVLFDKTGLSNLRRHITSEAQAAAVIASPYVIKRGEVITGHRNHKGNGYPTLTFAAPVEINGKTGTEAVAVMYTTKNRVHAVEILSPDGTEFVIEIEKDAGSTRPVASPKGAVNPTDPASAKRIPQPGTDVKVQKSERDNSVSDRELLREAAEHEGASEELKKYGKKADNLEAYQKRLERQEKKLQAEDLSTEERAALEGRIAETEALIGRTQDALTRMELRPSMQQKIQEARTRWWSENIPDAVQTAREIQKENRELREAVNYYREQAQHTTPENRSVDKDDIRRFAKALLKEHGSSADIDQLSRQLQTLGDKLVQGTADDLNDRELRNIARAAARMIANEVYEDVNADQKEMQRDITERVRGTRLQISESLRGDIPDFNEWRKRHFGTFRLVNEGGRDIDEFYQTLSDEFGEGIFPRDIMAPSDQLSRMQTVLQGFGPKYEYALTEMEYDEVVGLVTQEIMDTMLSGEIREAETIADRNYRAMEQRMLAAREAQRKAELAAKRAERRADNAEMTALREAREELKAINREKIKQLRKELNEGREAQQKRINIERQRARLSRMLRENSAKNHVPEALRGVIGRFIQSLDTLGPFSEGTKSAAKFREEMQELSSALRSVKDSTELNDFYGDLDLTEGVRVMLQNNIDQVEAAIGKNEGTVTRKMSLEQLRTLEETLNVLSTAVKNVNSLLSDGEHRFAHMDELGEESILENYKIAERKKMGGELGRQLKWANLTPYYAFKRFGEAGQEIFRGLTRGWGKMARNIDQVQKYAEGTWTAAEAKSWESKEHSFKLVPRTLSPDGKSAVKSGSMDLKADAVDVTMTEAQIMSLYCLNRREQARGHLYGAGIRIGDYKIGHRKPTSQSEHYLLDPDDMATIVKTLSPRQIEVCDALVKYMNTVGSSWGNEVSMKLYGIRGFTEENYFPIRTDSTQHKARTADSDRGNLFRLANQSFTKQLAKNANNAIIVDSVFDVFSDHMADMAKYNAMVLPMLDAMRWYNYQGEKASVQQAIRRAFGGDAGRYFMDFMQDLNGASEGGRGEQVVSRRMSGVKVASVGANLRVALQQPTSIARAALLLNPKYLAAGAAIKGGRTKALQYSGLAVWKDLGYFDVNVNRGMREQIKHADTLKEKIQDKSLWLAEKGDQMTWGALWNACELETKDKTGLSGEELMQKTAERFDEVILATQVMDSTLTRSSNMRSKSVMMKEFTAFMAEPTLTYNMLLDCWSEFDKIKRTNGTAAAVNKMKGPVLRTASVYVMSAALTAVAQAIGDAGRDDDDYETWLQKFWQHWTEDFADNLNPTKLIPIVQDLWNMIVEKRDKNLLVLQPIQQGIQVWNIWKERYQLATGQIDRATKTTWYGNMTNYGAIYKTLQFMSSLTGLPMGSATREFQSGYNTFLRPLLNETIGKANGKELPKWRTYDAGPEKQIQSALEGGYLDEEQAKALLIEEGVAKDETEASKTVYKWGLAGTAAYKAVKEAAVKGDEKGYREAMKAMTDAGYTEEDVRSEVKGAIKEQYLQPESGQELSKAYCINYLQKFAGMNKAEAEETAQKWTCYKVTGIAYEDIEEAYRSGEISAGRALELSVTYGPATAKMNQGWTEHAKPAGIDSASYYRFWLEAGEMRSDKDANGKEIKGQAKQDKVVAYINSLNISRAQKDALYLSMYAEKNLKKTPWNK